MKNRLLLFLLEASVPLLWILLFVGVGPFLGASLCWSMSWLWAHFHAIPNDITFGEAYLKNVAVWVGCTALGIGGGSRSKGGS